MAALEAHQDVQKAAVATLDTEVTELQKANAAKLTTVEQLEAKLAPFLTRLDTIANERDTLHKGTTAAKQELAAQKAETEKIQAESNAVKAEISRMEMQMHQAQVMANAKAATERRAMATAAATGHRPTAAAAGPRPIAIGPPPPRGPPRPPPQHQQQQNRGMLQTQLPYGGQQGQVQARPPLHQGQQQSQAKPTSYQPSPTAQMTNGPRGAQMAPRPAAAAVGTGAPVPSGFDYDESGMDADVDRGSAGNAQQAPAMMQRQPSGSTGMQSYQQQHGLRPTAGISVADIAAMDLQAFGSIYNSNSSSSNSGGVSNSHGGAGPGAGLPNGKHSSNAGYGSGEGDDDAEMINSYDFEMQSDYSGVPAGVAVGTSGYSHNTTIAPSVPASDFDGQSVAGASTAATVGGAYNPYGGQQYQGYGQHMHQQQPMMMPPPQQQYQGYQQQQQQSVDPRRAGMTTTMPPPPPPPRPAAAAINTMTGTSGLKPGMSTMNAPPRGQAAPAFASPPARGPVGGQAGARPTSDINNSGGYGATQYQNQNQPPRPSSAAGTGGPAGGSQIKAPPPPHLQASKLGVHNHQRQYQQQPRPVPYPSAAVGGPPRGPLQAPRLTAAHGAGQGQPMGLRAMPPPRPTTHVLGR